MYIKSYLSMSINITFNLSVLSIQLLGPEDMINPHVDELSMMTYLSQFPDAKLKEGAPIKARADPGKVCVCVPTLHLT